MTKTISIRDKDTIKKLHNIKEDIGLKYFIEVINFLIKRYEKNKKEMV